MKYTSTSLKEHAGINLKGWPAWIGALALVWSALYGALHLYWLLSGEGYPFGKSSDLGPFTPVVTYLPAQVGGSLFVILCLLGVLIGIAMWQTWGRVLPRWFVLAYSWGFAAGLLLFVPDTRLIAAMAYAFLFKFAFTWQMLNQVICLLGALLWGFAAVVYQRKMRHTCLYCGRTGHDGSFFLVRWRRWITVLAALAPLPYALIRWAWALNIPLGVDSQFLPEFSRVNPMATITEWTFGALCIGGGLLTLGLIQKWGEIFPRWFPFIGGKNVPVLLAVLPASLVAIAVTAAGFVFTYSFIAVMLHLVPVEGIFVGQLWGAVGPTLLWIPWGVALGLATIAYAYRRRGRCKHCGLA
ncbi:MAG: hypothetical protein IMW89_03705 [Ktedonobacteraceae bacterium]|nr:hypothetical protein [Ktedonobacteraceae bacterium]